MRAVADRTKQKSAGNMLGLALAIVALLVNLAVAAIHAPKRASPAFAAAVATPSSAERQFWTDLRLICRPGKGSVSLPAGIPADDDQPRAPAAECPVCTAFTPFSLPAPHAFALSQASSSRPPLPAVAETPAAVALPIPRNRGPPLAV